MGGGETDRQAVRQTDRQNRQYSQYRQTERNSDSDRDKDAERDRVRHMQTERERDDNPEECQSAE